MEILIRNTLNHWWGVDSQPPPPVTGPLGFKGLTDSPKYSVTALIFLCGVILNHVLTPKIVFLYFASLAISNQKSFKANIWKPRILKLPIQVVIKGQKDTLKLQGTGKYLAAEQTAKVSDKEIVHARRMK